MLALTLRGEAVCGRVRTSPARTGTTRLSGYTREAVLLFPRMLRDARQPHPADGCADG